MFAKAKEKRKPKPSTAQPVIILRFVLAMAAWIILTSLLVRDTIREDALIRHLRANGEQTSATILNTHRSSVSKNPSYAVTYSYEVAGDGQSLVPFVLTHNINSEEYGRLTTGGTVNVIYATDAPEMSRTVDTVTRWNYQQRLGESALVIVIFGAVLLYMAVPKRWIKR